ncbi:hypothetical protein BGZ72_001462, partial [Mortierella alpina]
MPGPHSDRSRQGQAQSVTIECPSPPPRPLSPEEQIEQMNLLDDLMDDIGMGKFQKQLLVLCGLGWFADNMWLQCIALILPRVQAQFEIEDRYIGILSSSMFVGMMFGAMFWGMLSDAQGRKQAFNFTLIVTTVFGIAASFANSYWLLCLLILCLGFGVGGNMPVGAIREIDMNMPHVQMFEFLILLLHSKTVPCALFLEFTPKKNQHLLTFLSIFFSFGAAATSLLGYFLLPPFSCETNVEGGCQGKGWRYMLLALGGVTLSMVVGRVILFRLEESPKYLLNQNRHQEAAMVLCRIFKINHSEPQSDTFEENIETLTSRFNKPACAVDTSSGESSSSDSDSSENGRELGSLRRGTPTSEGRNRPNSSSTQQHGPKYKPLFQRYRHRWSHSLQRSLDRLKPLLAPRFRLSSILIWTIWALVAFAYTAFNVFLPKFLQEHGASGSQSLRQVYMDTLVYAIAGIPGSVLATFLVEGRLGRRYTMAVSTFGASLAAALFTVLKSHAAMTTFSALLSLLSTLNYAVLYSYTPEVFPSDIRGTACGVAAAMSRLAGIVSPLIVGAMLTVSTYFPLWASFATFLISAPSTLLGFVLKTIAHVCRVPKLGGKIILKNRTGSR